MNAYQLNFYRRSRAAGFSIVELLSVVAIIGVLVGLALPHIVDTNRAAKIAVAQRNAQNIATIFVCGQVAGVDWGASSVATAVNSVFGGRTAIEGSFAGKVFKIASIPASDLPLAEHYLRWDSTNATLAYVQTPSP